MKTTKRPDYIKSYENKLNQNLELFNVDENLTKIKNFCAKFNFDEREVIESIQTNKFLKSWFVKDPKKQNIYENTFAEFLEEFEFITNIKRLPNSGGDSVFIINQEIRTRKNSSKSIITKSKSMDLSFDYGGVTFYVFHKYTNDRGGGQDNQKYDVINAINHASGVYTNDKIFILFICDGKYYSGKVWEEIELNIKDDNFKLLKSEQLEDFLNGFKDKY